MSDRLDPAAIREIFFGELQGYLRFFRSAAPSLAAHSEDHELVEELLRQVHSLKGSAATMGLGRLARAVAALEPAIERSRRSGAEGLRALGGLLEEGVSVLAAALPALRDGREHEFEVELGAFEQLCQGIAQPRKTGTGTEFQETPRTKAGRSGNSVPVPVFRGGALSGSLLADLREAFVLEALDHVEELERGLLRLEGRPGEEAILRPLMRTAHTLKGSAATVSYTELGELAHRIEDVLETAVECRHPLEDQDLHLLFQALDGVQLLIEDVRQGSAAHRGVLASLENYFAAVIQRIQQSSSSMVEKPSAAPAPTDFEAGDSLLFGPGLDLAKLPAVTAPRELLEVTEELDEEPEPTLEPLAERPPRPAPESAAAETSLAEPQYLRVGTSKLDSVMNLVGELIINRNRLARRLEDLSGLSDELAFSKGRLLGIVQDFRDRYEFTRGLFDARSGAAAPGDFKELEFDKFDEFNLVSRNLVEIASDIAEIVKQATGFFASFNVETDQISRVTGKLQEEISTIRHVPLGRLFQRFRRLVHDAAYNYGKQIDLELLGTDTELDRTIAEEIAEPLIHLLRNAVYHGIESPSERLRAGKPAAGSVKLRAYQAGSRVVLEVEDDGAGMDLEAVQRRGIELGLLDPEGQPAAPETLELIFQPGFTMARQVDGTAGRGVGLDAVRACLQKLHGEVRVATQAGRGTKFTLTVPLSLAISQILTVRAGQILFGLPVSVIEEVLQVERDAIIEHDQSPPQLVLREQRLPLLSLAGLMRIPSAETSPQRALPLVVLSASERRAALQVDEIVGREETLIRTFRGFLRRFKLISGATISSEGQITLVLDVASLMELGPRLQPLGRAALPAARVAKARLPRLLLVDDSISIRKFVGALLTQAGFEVDLASDGLEAFQKVTAAPYDLIITDLEMPVMHGYELIAELKRHPQLRAIPIIILTSRAGEKHRLKALEMGARDYVVKPFNEEDLIASVRHNLKASSAS